ncbi:MAG TPA: glycosyltransferase family 2 protein [Thermoanaerobaculia bacterium]|nr:glycosyltransferase family 2 protein [Thermoanaerobaculia bacterium]
MRTSAVVLTLGRSPLLVPCLEALRRDGGSALEIVLVDQGETPVDLPAGLADKVLRPGRNLGFAAGNDLGMAEAAGDWVAAVNDDAVVEPGWLESLIAALAADPSAAAAQGINVQLAAPGMADGCGLIWNGWWQAVQRGHGEPVPPPGAGAREVFGASATAVVYRREALRQVAAGGEVFDPRLFAYYEDVELAVRLRAAGWRALLVPAARVRHAGSSTGRTLRRERWRLLYGNRWLVVARLLGRSFWIRVPVLAARDLIDLVHALGQGDGELAAGIPAGWTRALRLLPGFARCGAAAVALGEIRRFR